MTPALQVYESGLTSGCGELETEDGDRSVLPIGSWSGMPDPGDLALLDRYSGPTLDVGCGPGRMTAALTNLGIPTLGIDISSVAVQMTIARGGMALQRNIFDQMPADRRWAHILLADGNIGIGGDAVRLLSKCAGLLTPGGTILVDVGPPGTALIARQVRVAVGGRTSGWFRWSWLGVDALSVISAAAGLAPTTLWRNGSRWQAELAASDSWPAVGSTR
ncbi:MAG: class I SAM-dependent methyltransferase [Actinomycetota bacterium]|nr:class I SAM-dependent methyltransferase [Actinomycetota bacterium]